MIRHFFGPSGQQKHHQLWLAQQCSCMQRGAPCGTTRVKMMPLGGTIQHNYIGMCPSFGHSGFVVPMKNSISICLIVLLVTFSGWGSGFSHKCFVHLCPYPPVLFPIWQNQCQLKMQGLLYLSTRFWLSRPELSYHLDFSFGRPNTLTCYGFVPPDSDQHPASRHTSIIHGTGVSTTADQHICHCMVTRPGCIVQGGTTRGVHSSRVGTWRDIRAWLTLSYLCIYYVCIYIFCIIHATLLTLSCYAFRELCFIDTSSDDIIVTNP